MNQPVVIVSFFDLGCAMGPASLCAFLNHHGQPAKLIHFGLTQNYPDTRAVHLLQCRGFLNITYIDPPPESLYDECLEQFAALDPLLVGISFDSRMTPFARHLAERLAARFPNLPVIGGGLHPTLDPEHALHFFNTICIGEGEDALLEVSRRIEARSRDFRGIPNLAGVAPDGQRYLNPLRLITDLDRLPPPYLDDQDRLFVPRDGLERMRARSRYEGGDFFKTYCVVASRGCRFRCSYCYAGTVRQRLGVGPSEFVRRRSVDHLFGELSVVKTLPQYQHIWFWDDIFGNDRSWLEEFAERYPREIGLPFSCHLAPYTAGGDFLELLQRAGCYGVGVGMQTGSARIHREYYQRPFDRELAIDAARRLHPRFLTAYDLIINNPYEREDDIRETLSLFLEFPLPFRIATNSLLFFPGQTLTQRALGEGIITQEQVVGFCANGEYPYADITHRPPGDDRDSRRLYSLYLLVCATQHHSFERSLVSDWSRDSALLEHPEELERRLLLQYVEENERELLDLEARVVGQTAEIAGLHTRLQNAASKAGPPVPAPAGPARRLLAALKRRRIL